MSIFKCKMCGGTIEFEQGATVGVCEYCGTKQTLPQLNDNKKKNLYERANHYRRNNEFDKAMNMYERILNEESNDAETYWSMVLCRYGIEYVEDPDTHKRVPTVNRTQYTSIFNDADYKSALQYADGYQKAIYEEEAEAINNIQKNILEISQNEEPFDVFICYKETDANGRRTQDSVLANELYHQLTLEGFKVFFSRITLEDKLGVAYEPYIFAALNSAKVMVVLGTKPEYFEAVWVKNEWSRYLALVKNGAKKMLIPAYRDMDPYDLPEEFSHLQAQDMSKLGFMQDLLRGIKKIILVDEPKSDVKETRVENTEAVNIAPLLKRVFLFLEDEKWEAADEYCERVLDQDPENAQAYLGKLMAELEVCRQELLKDCEEPFDSDDNYQKVLRYADSRLAETVKGYISHINARNEETRLTGIYNDAVGTMKSADTEEAYKAASAMFKTIPGFKDADEQVSVCQRKLIELKKREEERKEANRIEQERKEMERRIAAEKRKKIVIITLPIVAACIALILVLNIVILPILNYNKAVDWMNGGQYDKAISAFKGARGYKDSMEQLEKCYMEKYGEELYHKIKNVRIGGSFKFGSYEQDGNVNNGKEEIEWIVLEKKEMSLLLVSKYALDNQGYNIEDMDITWAECSLRTWLNTTFLNEAFSSDEQVKIVTTRVSADKNPEYDTNPGRDTKDKIFLLSVMEVENYFNSDSARQCQATKNSANINHNNENCWWWLRTPGRIESWVTLVNDDGTISEYYHLPTDGIGVRPVLWVDFGI